MKTYIINPLLDLDRLFDIFGDTFNFRFTYGAMSAYFEKDGIWIESDYKINLDLGYNKSLLSKLINYEFEHNGSMVDLVVEVEK